MAYQQFICAGVAGILALSQPTSAMAQSQWGTAADKSATIPASSPAGPAFAELVTPANGTPRFYAIEPKAAQSKWRTSDTKSAALKWEIGYLALGLIDTAQTIHCLNRGTCEEANPIVGKNPSAQKLILAKLAASAVHLAAFRYVSDRNAKMALRFAQISCALQGTVVVMNARIAF